MDNIKIMLNNIKIILPLVKLNKSGKYSILAFNVWFRISLKYGCPSAWMGFILSKGA